MKSKTKFLWWFDKQLKELQKPEWKTYTQSKSYNKSFTPCMVVFIPEKIVYLADFSIKKIEPLETRAEKETFKIHCVIRDELKKEGYEIRITNNINKFIVKSMEELVEAQI